MVNTFTVGNVTITLDETDVDDSTPDVDRDTANTYRLVPGSSYTKDPTIHVAEGSEDCYVFVKVENGLVDIEADTTIAEQMTTEGWTDVAERENIYQKADKVVAGADVVVFETLNIAPNADVAAYADANITVTAFAIQAEGLTVEDAAKQIPEGF